MNPTTNEGMLALLKEDLTKHGVEVDKLGVVMMGKELIYGEIQEVRLQPHTALVKNPRRMIRLEQIQSGNFRVDFLLIDFDLISGGTIAVVPEGLYFLSELDDESQGRMLALYRGYLENKKRAKAAEAGIVIPENNKPVRLQLK